MTHTIRRVTYAALATAAVVASLLAASHQTGAPQSGGHVHFSNVFVATRGTLIRHLAS